MERSQAQCFGATRGEIETRADVNFSRLLPLVQERLANAAYPAASLGSKLTLVQYGSSTLASTEPVGVPIVRMNNLQQDGWALDDLKYVILPEKEVDSYRIEPGDILFNRTNSKELVGKCEVFREPGKWVFASYLIRVRTNPLELDSQFASDFLNAPIGRLQIDCVSRQIVGMTNINSEEIRDFGIPLPPLPVQQELVAAMNVARARRQQQLAEAEALLGGVDSVVLSALGIDPNPPQRNVFTVQAGQVLGRVDADFHSPRFQAFRHGLENGKYPAESIAVLCTAVISGFAAGRQDQVFDLTAGVPHLRPLNLSARGELSIAHTKFVPTKAVSAADYCQPGEVLFNNTNSAEMVGKSAVFDLTQPCACSNHMTRLRLTAEVDPYYLAALFNALRSIGYLSLVCTKFNNQAGINTETLLEMKVPVPPPAVQREVVAEVQRRRSQAQQLREAAETGWAAAKAAFEARLLAPTQV